jgi:hypothetical protein
MTTTMMMMLEQALLAKEKCFTKTTKPIKKNSTHTRTIVVAFSIDKRIGTSREIATTGFDAAFELIFVARTIGGAKLLVVVVVVVVVVVIVVVDRFALTTDGIASRPQFFQLFTRFDVRFGAQQRRSRIERLQQLFSLCLAQSRQIITGETLLHDSIMCQL